MAVNADVFRAVAQTLEGLQLAETANARRRRRSRPTTPRTELRIAA
jgi:hypothetical protein